MDKNSMPVYFLIPEFGSGHPFWLLVTLFYFLLDEYECFKLVNICPKRIHNQVKQYAFILYSLLHLQMYIFYLSWSFKIAWIDPTVYFRQKHGRGSNKKAFLVNKLCLLHQ